MEKLLYKILFNTNTTTGRCNLGISKSGEIVSDYLTLLSFEEMDEIRQSKDYLHLEFSELGFDDMKAKDSLICRFTYGHPNFKKTIVGNFINPHNSVFFTQINFYLKIYEFIENGKKL